jgi:hydrocephalus-inducing protein
LQEDSPYFRFISPPNIAQKVGPGLALTFRVQFTPQENKDYYHELSCVTEREKFVIPVRAIGPRAMLDFPDEINFPASPVKHASSKVLFVRNVGKKDAKFMLTVSK